MASDDAAWPERATHPSSRRSAPSTARDPSQTIEQRYELEVTIGDLGLEDGPVAVPIGPYDRFLIRKLLGRGNMGAVYLADDRELERRVAIKVVSRRVEHQHVELRLRREARALAALDHPNVLKIFDLGDEHGELFIAMEYVAGMNLRQWQQGRSLDEVLDAYLHAGRGLAAAHARGIVHRDFKPDNVLVDEEAGRRRVRVGDFGLAGATEPVTTRGDGLEGDGLKTSDNALLGTVPYMAPEQLQRERADARSDQHQFCVSLWEAVARARPFGRAGHILDDADAIPARPPAMPRWLYRVLDRGLAYRREHRFPSMDDLLAALLSGRRRQRAIPWLGAGALALTTTSVAWAIQPDPCQAVAGAVEAQWTPQARADIEAAFGSPDPEGDGTMAGYLVERLDQAAARWSDAAQQVCQARQGASVAERPALDQRTTCLDRWLDRLGRRIEWLRDPEPAHKPNAYALVAPLAHAGDSCALPPPMLDAAVEQAIDRAEQAELLRDLDGALTLADEAVALATDQGTACPTPGPDEQTRSSELAAALYRRGHVRAERGESGASLEDLTGAHRHANACRDEHRDAEALVHSAKVLAVDLEQIDAARERLDDAWIALAHVDEPPVSLRRYDLRMAAGLAAEHAREYEAARDHATSALDALGDPADYPVLAARLSLNIGVTFQKEGRYVEAAKAFAHARSLVEEALGPTHAQVRLYRAREVLNLGLADAKTKKYATMRQHLREATASEEPLVVVKALTAWAQGEFRAKAQEAASARAYELLAFLDQHPDLPQVTLATAETTAGQVLGALLDPACIPVLKRGCARWPEDHPKAIASCKLSLGAALWEADRLSEARQVLTHLQRLDLEPNGPESNAIEDFARTLQSPPASHGQLTPSTQGTNRP